MVNTKVPFAEVSRLEAGLPCCPGFPFFALALGLFPPGALPGALPAPFLRFGFTIVHNRPSRARAELLMTTKRRLALYKISSKNYPHTY